MFFFFLMALKSSSKGLEKGIKGYFSQSSVLVLFFFVNEEVELLQSGEDCEVGAGLVFREQVC